MATRTSLPPAFIVVEPDLRAATVGCPKAPWPTGLTTLVARLTADHGARVESTEWLSYHVVLTPVVAGLLLDAEASGLAWMFVDSRDDLHRVVAVDGDLPLTVASVPARGSGWFEEQADWLAGEMGA